MSAETWAQLAWIVPVGLIVTSFLMVLAAVMIDGARRDRYQRSIYRAEMARRSLERALRPDPHLRVVRRDWDNR